MAELSVINKNVNGSQIAFTSANSGGDSFAYGTGRRLLVINNQDGSSHTVTLLAQNKCKFGFLHDEDIVVPAGEIHYAVIDERFIDDNDMVHLTYDSVTSLQVAVIKY